MIQRRFIAGAICPRCGQLDRIVMYDDEGGQRIRECVSCGYRDALDTKGNPRELETRVNRPRAGEKPLAHEDEVRVINILDAGAGGKRHDDDV